MAWSLQSPLQTHVTINVWNLTTKCLKLQNDKTLATCRPMFNIYLFHRPRSHNLEWGETSENVLDSSVALCSYSFYVHTMYFSVSIYFDSTMKSTSVQFDAQQQLNSTIFCIKYARIYILQDFRLCHFALHARQLVPNASIEFELFRLSFQFFHPHIPRNFNEGKKSWIFFFLYFQYPRATAREMIEREEWTGIWDCRQNWKKNTPLHTAHPFV